MLDCYYIRKIFDLPEYFVITECEESEGIITIHITLERTAHHCPHCNVLTDKVHDYRKQRIQHAVVNNRPVMYVRIAESVFTRIIMKLSGISVIPAVFI